MFRRLLIVLVSLARSPLSHAAQPNYGDGLFCAAVNKYVTALQEQRPATTFCSSYLHIPTTCTTRTVTPTQTITSNSVSTAYVTNVATVTKTAISTSLQTVGTTVVVTLTNGHTTTQILATSTITTATVTTISTSTVTAIAVTSVPSTTTMPLMNCAPPRPTKRALQRDVAKPKPKCLSGYKDAPIISKACSCLSIPKQTVTRTATAKPSTVVVMSTQTTTSTLSSTMIATATSVTTVLQQSTLTATLQVDSTTTITSAPTMLVAATTTSITTESSTTTSTAYPVVTALSNFALLSSLQNQYGLTKFYSGGHSGKGIYFSGSDESSAAKFAFAGTKLYYNGDYISAFQASSGNYYPVVDRPYIQSGYNMDCNLNTNGPSGSCPLDCYVGGSGLFPPGSGNDIDNYGGVWGLQGPTDRFTVYAVGQT